MERNVERNSIVDDVRDDYYLYIIHPLNGWIPITAEYHRYQYDRYKRSSTSSSSSSGDSSSNSSGESSSSSSSRSSSSSSYAKPTIKLLNMNIKSVRNNDKADSSLSNNGLNNRKEEKIIEDDIVVSCGCNNHTSFKYNIDYKGGDIMTTFHINRHNPYNNLLQTTQKSMSNPIDVRSPSECCWFCAQVNSCYYWTIVDNRECWLKGKAVAAEIVEIRSGNNKNKRVRVLVSGVKALVDSSDSDSSNSSSRDKLSNNNMINNRINNQHDNLINSSVVCNAWRNHHYIPLKVQLLNHESTVLDKLLFYMYYNNSHHEYYPTTKTTSILQKVDSSHLPALTSILTNSAHIFTRHTKLTDISPTTITLTKRLTTDWTSQFPIGNGLFGALIGGTIKTEVIPISIAGKA